MISEIFPLHFRGIGMAIAVSANWAMDTVVSMLFPAMKEDLGMTTTSFIYAGFTVVAVLLGSVLHAGNTRRIPRGNRAQHPRPQAAALDWPRTRGVTLRFDLIAR